MTTEQYIHVGDIGTILRFNLVENVSTALIRRIYYEKPKGAGEGFWDADLYGTTQIQYITTSGDMSIAGAWRFQPYVEMPDWKGWGTVVTKTVKPNIGE